MDRSTARSLLDALKTFLAPFEDEHDLKINLGSGRFDDTTLTIKLELAEVSESGETLSRAANEFKTLALSFGLQPDDLGKEFKKGNNRYKIIGLQPRSHKYPVLVESATGKKYKFPASDVRFLLGRNKPKRPKEEILKELRNVEDHLSPENLTCDGEAPSTWVRQRASELTRQKRDLIAELGYTPDFKELYPEIYK